jgi:hypothetical protein
MRPRADSPAITSALYTILAHVPDDRLRQLLLILLSTIADAPAPAAAEAVPEKPRTMKRRSRRGWPKGKPRGRPRKVEIAAAADQSSYAKLRARRERDAAARRARRAAKAANGNGRPTSMPKASCLPTPTGEALWAKAEALRPKDPWKAVARGLGLNEAVVLDAFRHRTVPPGAEDNAIARFIERPAP